MRLHNCMLKTQFALTIFEVYLEMIVHEKLFRPSRDVSDEAVKIWKIFTLWCCRIVKKSKDSVTGDKAKLHDDWT